jgi:hypothetical protein
MLLLDVITEYSILQYGIFFKNMIPQAYIIPGADPGGRAV